MRPDGATLKLLTRSSGRPAGSCLTCMASGQLIEVAAGFSSRRENIFLGHACAVG